MALKHIAQRVTCGACALFLISGAAQAEPIEDSLQRFVEDYARDPMAVSVTFGIEVDGKRWHVASQRRAGGGAAVTLKSGFPEMPIFYFTTDAATLDKIDSGALSGLTAMAAATSDQATPLDIQYANGYERPAGYDALVRPLIFHFWTRGRPEVVPLDASRSRVVHGAPGTVMYYAKDFRSAVYHIPPGLSRESSPTLTVPFPRVLVTLQGVMTGTVSGQAFIAPAEHMVLIPPGAPAQLWNDSDAPLKIMFLMFGEGA